MKNLIKKPRKLFNLLTTMIYCYMFSICTSIQVFAEGTGGGLKDSTIVTGTNRFLDDLTIVLIGLTTTIGVAVIIFFALRMAITSEEHEKSKYKKAIIITLLCVAGGLSASGIVAMVDFYF